MTETLALLAIGIGLLAACAMIMETARVMARARIRRQRRLVRLSSVVTGLQPVSPHDQLS
ncbi:MAG: hypothetical protein ABSB23_12295 [Bryobacteraceae bacterium]|jgi:hypothetical protein